MNDSTLSNDYLLRLPTLSVLDIDGNESEAILHNLTTNQIKTLEVDGVGVETFITNVKGKCLGHVLVFRTPTGFRLIGAGATADRTSQSETIAAHADRYTIREDAVPTVKDDQLDAWLFVGGSEDPGAVPLSYRGFNVGGTEAGSYVVPWIRLPGGRDARLVLVPAGAASSSESVLSSLVDVRTSPANVIVLGEDESGTLFHSLRIESGFPWYGIDCDETHLPQEVGRESLTISFTKGCYLGQETVARLDALGQVQKMLVPWSIETNAIDELPPVDTKLFASSEKSDGEKPVGRLTSVARTSSNQFSSSQTSSSRIVALGYARRSHFEPGATAVATIDTTEFTATVVSLTATQGV